MHMDAPFCDVVLVVRTWMRFMMCDMFVCMIKHVDAPMDSNVFLWCYVLCTQMLMQCSLFGFLYIWMICYGVMIHDGDVT